MTKHESISINPSWTEAARLLAMVCRNGTDEGRAEVAAEVERMGQIIDYLQEAGQEFDQDPVDADQAQYISPIPLNMPEPYDTVLGYLARHVPEALNFDAWDPELTKRDGYWLCHRARERGIEVIKVPAPGVMMEQGIRTVNAYPVSLLQERLGG